MTETTTEKLPTGHIIEDENHNYFPYELTSVNEVVDNETQLLCIEEYHPLTSFPAVGTDGPSMKQAQPNKINYPNVEQNKKSYSGSSNEESFNEEDVNSGEVSSDIMTHNSGAGDSNYILWGDLDPSYKCDICYYGSKKRYLLLRHMKTHKSTNRNAKKINHKVGKDKDSGCEQPLINVSNKSNTKSNENIEDNDGCEQQRTFVCDECSYSTNKKYLLLRHTRIHSGERPHKCSICERGFTTKSSLQAHINMHYGVKNNICKFCERPFTTSGQLNRHVKYKHTQEKPHKCTECDYAAVEGSKLRRHMRFHSGERPYQCQHCTYASQDSSQLKRHLRTHTGEKPYKCVLCNAMYANSSSLKTHTWTHNTQRKVHSCELCPAKNVRKSELRQHFKRMHFSEKPLKCKRCGEIFSDRYSIKVHNKIHKCEKCFKCQLCPFATKKFIHLKTHMMMHSKIQNDLDASLFLNNFPPSY